MSPSEKERKLKALKVYKAIYGKYPRDEDEIESFKEIERRIKASSEDEIESIEVLKAFTEEIWEKGIEAEEHAEKWLIENFKKKIVDMRYSQALTKTINQILEAIEGRGFVHGEKLFGKARRKEPGIRGERLLSLQATLINNYIVKMRKLLSSLDLEVKEELSSLCDEMEKIIKEIFDRFQGLDGKNIVKLLGELKGTKMDWIAYKDGASFFDAKSWDGELCFKIPKTPYDHYWSFRKIGIPFFLLLYNRSNGRIYWHEVTDPSHPEIEKQGEFYLIPRKFIHPKEE